MMISEMPEMTEKLRAAYLDFDAVLKFVTKRRHPECKCSIYASPRPERDEVSFGYSNGTLHVAAAICMACQMVAEASGDFPEVQSLTARHKGSTWLVRVYGFDLIYFVPLNDAEIRKAKTTWIERLITRSKSKGSVITPTKLKLLKKVDPWKSGFGLWPYMPGGEWVPEG
jgi:hypothetical protein